MSELPDPDIDRLKKEAARLDLIKEQLLEHWDSVAIFVTRYNGGDDGGTDRVYVGGGNWFARYGQIRAWLVQADKEQSERDDEHE